MIQHCHALRIPGFATDKSIKLSACRTWRTMQHRKISLLDGIVTLKRPAQSHVRPLCPCKNHNAASLDVQPVDYSRPLVRPHSGDFRETGKNEIRKRPAFMPGSWMHNHSGRLVDHHDIAVFIYVLRLFHC